MDNDNNMELSTIPRTFQGEYVETRSFFIKNNNSSKSVIKVNSSRSAININTIEDYNKGYGYCNLRIIGNPKMIEYASIYLGGEYTSIRPCQTGDMTIHIMSKHILPALRESSYCRESRYDMLIDHFLQDINDDIQVDIDIVKITNPLIGNEIGIFRSLISSDEGMSVIEGDNKLNYTYGFFIKNIKIRSHTALLNLILRLDNNSSNDIKLNKVKDNSYEYKYECIFNAPINFNRIERPFFYIYNNRKKRNNSINRYYLYC